MKKYKALLICVNHHMNSNPLYPGDWLQAFPNYINSRKYINELDTLENDSIELLDTYNFPDTDSAVLEIGRAFRSVGKEWCKENIVGYEHSEYNKNTILSKGRITYDENTETLDFWKRFLCQMLIYRYG